MADQPAHREVPPQEPRDPAASRVPDAEGVGDVSSGFDRKGRVRRTRTSGIWIGLIIGAIFLALLIVFIAQNSSEATVHFLGWSGQFPLWLAILFAALAGMLLVAVPGTVRIFQLRRSLRRNASRTTDR